MDDKKQVDQQKPVVVYGVANIGCDQTGVTFQTLVVAPEGTKAEKAEEVEDVELVDLKFFDAKNCLTRL